MKTWKMAGVGLALALLCLMLVYAVTFMLELHHQRTLDAEAARITAYCKELEDGEVSHQNFELSTTTSNWEPVTSLGVMGSNYEGAEAFVADGAVLYAKTYRFASSSDWARLDDYCFRKDGTLAKALGALSTVYTGNEDGVRVRKDLYFDAEGGLFASSTQVLDLVSEKPVQSDYQDHDLPIYKMAKDLPFAALIDR